MRASDYEDFVAEIIRELSLPSPIELQVRTRLPGIRQPGNYEIDVVVRFRISDVLEFLLIVECKNWKRPVDRPIVQKLVQTRDAVAAHKAVIVSPVGFTTAAVDVAKAHGIALWVLAKGAQLMHISAHGVYVPDPLWPIYSNLRDSFLDVYEVKRREEHETFLVPYDAIERFQSLYSGLMAHFSSSGLPQKIERLRERPFLFSGSADNHDVAPAIRDLLCWVYELSIQNMTGRTGLLGQSLHAWRMNSIATLQRLGVPSDSAASAVDAIGLLDYKKFTHHAKQWLSPNTADRADGNRKKRGPRRSSA